MIWEQNAYSFAPFDFKNITKGNESMNAEILERMKNVDIRAVDPATLVDLNDVCVDQSLPREERIREFVRQVGNPYCFRVGKVAVKVNFTDNGVTLEDRLESLLMNI